MKKPEKESKSDIKEHSKRSQRENSIVSKRVLESLESVPTLYDIVGTGPEIAEAGRVYQ